jgi:hypothetical protein
MRGALPPHPNTLSWLGAQVNHKDTFTFTFYCLELQGFASRVVSMSTQTFYRPAGSTLYVFKLSLDDVRFV